MAAIALANIKVETEGDQQILYGTVASVTDGDTTTVATFFKKIRGITATSSTRVAYGATESAGVITWKCATSDTITSGITNSNLIVRIAGGA